MPSGSTDTPLDAPATDPDAPAAGLARALHVWRLWRLERSDPAPFYRLLARELADELESRHGPLAGRTIADLGCGPGFYTAALRERDAIVLPIDNDVAELDLAGAPPSGALVADATDLPLEAGSIDGIVCSNMLEHTPRPKRVISEIRRVLKPGGWAYVSFTNWYSPWGGHDITPYQYLGPRLGPRAYERLHGAPRKNVPGVGLFPCHIGPTVAFVDRLAGVRVDAVRPRYWPRLAFICRIPGVREVATWNCVIHMTRLQDGAPPVSV
jgi:SAM-dependent methyltransferase